MHGGGCVVDRRLGINLSVGGLCQGKQGLQLLNLDG